MLTKYRYPSANMRLTNYCLRKYSTGMKLRHHPFLILLSILLASLTLGLCGGVYFYHRIEEDFIEKYGTSGAGIDIGLGMIVGLVVGISAYVALKQRSGEEQPNLLNLTQRHEKSPTS